MNAFLLKIYLFQFILIKILNGLVFLKKCNNYVYALSKVYEPNFFFLLTYRKIKEECEYYYTEYGLKMCRKICTEDYTIETANYIRVSEVSPASCYGNDIYNNLNVSPYTFIPSQKIYSKVGDQETLCINFAPNRTPKCTVDIITLNNAHVNADEIKMNYNRINYENGSCDIQFISLNSEFSGNSFTILNTAYQLSDTNYFRNYYRECYFIMYFKIQTCPAFCNEKCEFQQKYCYSNNSDIENIIKNYIQKEDYSIDYHFGSTIVDNTNEHYYVYKINFENFEFKHNTYFTDFCPNVLRQKYNPIKYFVIFHNINNTENSMILKNDKQILNYKTYCENYTVENPSSFHIMDKSYTLNFSKYLLNPNGNEILNNTINYTLLKGKIEFENGSNYERLNFYQIDKLIIYFRDGIYYSQELRFQFTYGSLFFPYENPPKGNITFDIYPFYCNFNHTYNNRTCWTTYSLNGIKNEIQMAILDLHEHIDERIIGDDFIVDIFDNLNDHIFISFDSHFPLNNCYDVYKTIENNNIQGIIFVKFEVNNEIYYDIYKSDPNNHTKLIIDYCIDHKISDMNYQINDTIENFEFNLNDLISPKLIDSNTYDKFILTFPSDFKGTIKEELFLANTINIINYETKSPYTTQSRKYFYTPNRGYYSFFFLFELVHSNGLSYNMKGKITINILPEYCDKEHSIISEKKCFTNYNLDYIKNYILNDEDYYQIHFNEYIIHSLYNLTSIEIEELENKKCDFILKKLYGNDNYFVLIINEDQKGEIKELYSKEVVPFEKINEDLCKKVYDFKIDKVINYNSLIDIKDIIKDILPKEYDSNFFEIKIYTEQEYLKKHSRRLNSIQENNLVIEYIPDKFKYYNAKYYFEIEKDNIFFNIKGEINFKVFPFYCEDYNVNRNCTSNKTLEEIINYINVEDIENIKEHLNEIIYNDDYIFQIKKINSNLLSNKFDFELCEKEIRKIYFLNENETIYLETIENKKENKFSFHIFNSKGFEYNSSFCSSFTLKNMYNMDLYDVSNYQKLINLGYDIFNISSPFYNDLCISYSFNGNDISLKDRKEKIFPGNICYKNCDYKLFNNEINCECKINSNNQIFELNTNGLNIEFDNKTYFVNYKFVKCSNLVFNKNIFKIFGFWFMLLIIIIQIFILFLYLYNNENSLYNLVEVLDIEISKNVIILVNEKKNFTELKEKENGDSSLRKIVPNKKDNNSIEFEIRNHALNSLVSNIDYFTYSDSLKKDTRNYFSMLFSLIKEKSLFIRSIYKYSFFELQSINFFIFLLYISFILSFNVLLFSENYISEKFINHKISSLSNIKKMFFSSLFNMILIKIILTFNDYSTILNKIIYEFHGNSNFKFIALKNLDIQKFKIRTFLFINLIISLGLLYFVSSFCALYQKTQFDLFIGTIFSICFSYAIFLFLCIIISILRFISLNKKFEYIYYFSIYLRKII